ncbi:MAG: hypothetical protein VSS75_002390, partial [Candidatus Parabeggiatoa sp.]|nr:hypothetical protein [Candidatus Parabeggiatoa sp.]
VSDIPEKFDLKEDMTGLSKKIEFIRLSDILDSPLSVISYQLSIINYQFDNRLPLDITKVQEYQCFEN